MADRTTPYGAFNFLVDLNGPIGEEQPLGGFSDVSGLAPKSPSPSTATATTERTTSGRSPASHKVGDVTLKRGIVNSIDFWEWITQTPRAERRRASERGHHAARRGRQPGAEVEAGRRRADEIHRARRSPPKAAATSRWRSSSFRARAWNPKPPDFRHRSWTDFVCHGAAPVESDPARADIACFIGFVAQRGGDAIAQRGLLRSALKALGWSRKEVKGGGDVGPDLPAGARVIPKSVAPAGDSSLSFHRWLGGLGWEAKETALRSRKSYSRHSFASCYPRPSSIGGDPGITSTRLAQSRRSIFLNCTMCQCRWIAGMFSTRIRVGRPPDRGQRQRAMRTALGAAVRSFRARRAEMFRR